MRSATEAVEIAEAVGSKLAATEARTSLATIERRTRAPEEAARLLESVIEQATRRRRRAPPSCAAGTAWPGCGSSSAICPGPRTGYLAAHQRAIEHRPALGHLRASCRGRWPPPCSTTAGDWDAALRTLDTTGEQPTTIGDGVLRGVRMLIAVGRGQGDGVPDDFAQLRQYFRREGQIPLYAGFAAIELHEQRGDVAGALALIDELVEVLGELWLNPWFLARIQLSARGARPRSPRRRPARRRPSTRELAATGSQLASDGRTSAEKGLPAGRELGREGQAWLARLEAESARLRWLTGQDAPERRRAGRRCGSTRSPSSTTATSCRSPGRGPGSPPRCGPPAAPPRPPSRPSWPAQPPPRCGATPLLDSCAPSAAPPAAPRRRRPGRPAGPHRPRARRARRSSSRAAPTARSRPSSTSARRPSASTSRTSWPSSASAAGPRPRRWPADRGGELVARALIASGRLEARLGRCSSSNRADFACPPPEVKGGRRPASVRPGIPVRPPGRDTGHQGGRATRPVRDNRGSVLRPLAARARKSRRDDRHGRRHHEGNARVRRPLRAPDPALEPEDEALHPHRAQRALHHRPAPDAHLRRPRLRVRQGDRRARRHDPVRRHQEAGPGVDRRAGHPGRHALRQPALAGRHAHQLLRPSTSGCSGSRSSRRCSRAAGTASPPRRSSCSSPAR